MISGTLSFQQEKTVSPFTALIPAHADYIDIVTARHDAGWICLVTERDATRSARGAVCHGQNLTPAHLAQLRQDMAEWNLQSLLIEHDAAHGSITLTRNRRAECALFLAVQKNSVHLHWDPVKLYPYVDTAHPLDMAVATSFLEMHSRYRSETVFKDIIQLPERGVAICKTGTISIQKPPHIEPPTPVPLKPSADPVAIFHDLVRASLKRWTVTAEHTGAILSSGLDTTLVAHLLHEELSPYPLHSFGYWMLHPERDAIKDMRMETVKKAALIDYYPPIEDGLHHALSQSGHAWWPEQSATDFADIGLARHMQHTGITLVTTGIGGDELCTTTAAERQTDASVMNDQWEGDPHLSFSLLSDRCQAQAPAVDHFAWPVGYVGISTPCMSNMLNLIYLRHGIWCANPLAAPEIQLFANFLPVEWRRNRRLSREALLRLGYSPFFVAQTPKEDLSDTMETLMMQADFENIFKSAAICDLRLVDHAKLTQGVDIFRKTRSVAVGIKLLNALRLELSLRSL